MLLNSRVEEEDMNACIMIHILKENLDFITNNSAFFDANGECLDVLFDKTNIEYELAFTTLFNAEVLEKTNVLFIDIKENLLCGWYRNATLYMQIQRHIPTQRDCLAICKTYDAFLLSKETRMQIPFELPSFQDFLIADEKMTTDLLALLDALQATSQFVNLSLDISNELFNPDLTNEDIKQLLQEYQDTKDVSLIPALYWNAKKWSSKEPNNATPWDYIGFSLLELARPYDALPNFERAIKIDPLHKSASCDKGECLIRLNRIEDAISWLNEVIVRIPDDEVRLHLSDAYLLAGFHGISYRLLKEIQTKEIQDLIAPFMKETEEAMPYLLNANPHYSVLDAYPLFINFQEEPLPEVYEDACKVKRYVDPIRKKGIPISPEETVRQRVISYLLTYIRIPKEAMYVEESLAHIDRELRDRVDILVGQFHEGKRKFILLVECKAPGVALEGEPTTQLLRYNTILQAPFVLLTDSIVTHIYHFNKETSEYEALRELPMYKDMCGFVNIKYAGLKQAQWIRPKFTTLFLSDTVQNYTRDGIIGGGSKKELAPFLLNVAFCLLDELHKVRCPFVVPGCTVITDYGVIPMTTGNAGGGEFYGSYRWLGVLDRHGNRQNVYIGVFGMGNPPNDPSQTIRSEYTTLCFAIEEKGKATSRLQICLDACLIPDGEGYRLTHTGVRSRGKIQPLIDFIAESVPELLGTDERIFCGMLKKTKNLYLSDTEVAQTIGMATSYLLLRSEFRMIEKEKKS